MFQAEYVQEVPATVLLRLGWTSESLGSFKNVLYLSCTPGKLDQNLWEWDLGAVIFQSSPDAFGAENTWAVGCLVHSEYATASVSWVPVQLSPAALTRNTAVGLAWSQGIIFFFFF